VYGKARFFIKANRKLIQFIVLFILFFFLGQMAYDVGQPVIKRYIIPVGINQVSSKIINIITPQEKTSVEGEMLRSGNFSLRVAIGCDGFEALLILVAGIIAFSYLGWRNKFLGVLIGSIVIHLVNLSRIVALYYTSKYRPSMFDLMHVYIGQTFIILIGCLFFLFWIAKFAKTE